MAESVEASGFWLPSEFFDDLLTDKENLDNNADSDIFFPTEFPFDFQTDRDQIREKKGRVMSTSPQSTLAHMRGGSSNGSPNGVASPPKTPLGATNDALGDLIYRAAGQVARLKLNGVVGGGGLGPTRREALLGSSRPKIFNPSDLHKIHFQQHMVQQISQDRSGRAVGGVGQDAWPIQKNPTRNIGPGRRVVMLGGVKRECAGTGVFLPRRYGNNNNIKSGCNAYSSRMKTGYSAALVPNRNGLNLNKNFGKVNGFAQSQPHFQPNFNTSFVPDYDLLMARRNALMLQQQQHRLLEGSSRLNRGVYLPQEWTY